MLLVIDVTEDIADHDRRLLAVRVIDDVLPDDLARQMRVKPGSGAGGCGRQSNVGRSSSRNTLRFRGVIFHRVSSVSSNATLYFPLVRSNYTSTCTGNASPSLK